MSKPSCSKKQADIQIQSVIDTCNHKSKLCALRVVDCSDEARSIVYSYQLADNLRKALERSGEAMGLPPWLPSGTIITGHGEIQSFLLSVLIQGLTIETVEPEYRQVGWLDVMDETESEPFHVPHGFIAAIEQGKLDLTLWLQSEQ